MATGCERSETSSKSGFYFTWSPLLFGHKLLDLPLFFLLFNLGFFMNLLDGLRALVCSPRHPVALGEKDTRAQTYFQRSAVNGVF